MRVVFKITRPLLRTIHTDLSRPHAFALERVGFIVCKPAALQEGHALLADSYLPVDDGDYLDDPKYGAMMGPAAIRKALQVAYRGDVSMVHVHRHEHHGDPEFSRADIVENGKFIPDFFKVRPSLPHGALVLSHNSMFGEVWEPESGRRRPFDQLTVVGRPIFSWWRR